MPKIYLDNNSTTPVDPIVLKEMLPFFNEKFGNASSKSHSFGWEADAAVEINREKISELINSNSDEIIFTSGATESNNLALKSIYENNKNIITSTIEHRAILDICKKISKKDSSAIKYIKPNLNGIININVLESLIDDKTTLISIIHANNEIGVIQPIKQIGELCKKHNILFHVDAAQSLGKLIIDVKKMNIDLLSLSSHKIYGPKGIGALYVNNKILHKINPIILGGGQELNLRSGTLPVPLIVGFGKACEISKLLMDEENIRIKKYREKLISNILHAFPKSIVNGDIDNRISGNINISFPFLNGKSIITSIPKIAISSGSACTSSDPKPSHVLKELGINKLDSNTTLRIGIGRFNTKEDIKIASESIINAIKLKL